MFRSAALRLTLWYLAIIMAISLIFSGLLYRVSSNELNENVNRQIGYFSNFLGPNDFTNYSLLRQRQLDQDISRLKGNLVFFNILVLAGGGAASYWLARRTLRPIEEALEAQSRFAADASHELRTPLTAMQTENEVALRNQNLSKAEAIKLLESNLEEVGKLRSLSSGLLRLANGAGQSDFDIDNVSIKDIVAEATARYAKAAADKKIRINDNSKNVKVRGDKDSLVELTAIFIDNAIKYGRARSKIDISSRRSDKRILLSVTDEGQGIKASDLPHIFERFYRADSSRNKEGAGGYGLGLAIAKKIAEAHRGHIEVKSVPGQGSTFTVSLPAA